MKAILFFSVLFIAANVFAQTDVAAGLQQSFAQYQLQTTQEKLYVHTDKSSYVAGEFMWYKVYDVEASIHKPLAISKISYVELIDAKNKPVLQAKIDMNDGAGNGSFQLPFSMPSGNYVVRAYTNWMKNFSPDFFFEKQITIVNTLKNSQEENHKDSAVYNIQFFPEGGNLVDGLKSIIAFKGVDQYGQSIDFSGFLLNVKNDTLLRFQPFKFGMGKFGFTPEKNEQYRVVIKVNNQFVSGVFPQVYGQGYVMNLSASGNGLLTISVATNQQAAKPFVYLFVHSGHETEVVQSKTVSNGKAEFVVNANQLQEGISHFTLFSYNRQPLCERLFFKQPKQQLQIDVQADTQVQHTRGKIQLQIDTRNSSGPVVSNLSLSVFRTDSFQAATASDIFTYLWLSSEIKGVVQSPEYYLTDSSAEVLQASDNLMLTQGWRRFQWNDVIQNKAPAFHFLPEYEGQLIAGRITDETTGLPAAAGTTAYLSLPGEKFAFSTINSDENGNLLWAVHRFYGSGEAIAQTSDTTANHYHITLSDPFYSTPFHTSLPPFHLLEKWKISLLDNGMNAQAQSIYLPDETGHYIAPETDTTVFYGKPDKKYLLDDYTRFPTMEEVMREYVTEVRVSKAEEKYHYTVNNLPYRTFFKDEPLVLLDGVPVWNTSKIIAFNPLLVKQLDVVTHKYYFGNKTYDGIVSYITYKGDTGGLELNPNAVQIDYEGLQLEREFYTPVYETPQQQNSRLPDFRNVLYWSPAITTNSNGKATVTFYTSDLTGNYTVELQGNTAKGLAGSKVISIVVKK